MQLLACFAEVVLLLQAISVTEELLQDEVPDDEQLPSSAAAAAPKQPARPGPKIVLTQAPTIQLSSVLPATVCPVAAYQDSLLTACYCTYNACATCLCTYTLFAPERLFVDLIQESPIAKYCH